MQTEDFNKQCCGIFGKLFGHHFESLKTKGGVHLHHGVYYEFQMDKSIDEFLALQRDEYVVMCKRCGQVFKKTLAVSELRTPNSAPDHM